MHVVAAGDVEGQTLDEADGLNHGVGLELGLGAVVLDYRDGLSVIADDLGGGVDRHLVVYEGIAQEAGVGSAGARRDQDVVHHLDNLHRGA